MYYRTQYELQRGHTPASYFNNKIDKREFSCKQGATTNRNGIQQY